MTCELEGSDRSILEYRPNITFVEPDQQPGVIEGTDRLQFEDIQDARSKIKKMAKAVNTLATAVQARVDQRADGMFIQLDKDADADTVQAMFRRYPDDDPYKITYKQYRECRNNIRAKGEEIGKQALISPEQVEEARNRLSVGGSALYVPGGYNAEGAESGALRPELNSNGYIIPPVNIEKMQIDLICILVNFIWKNYIKKAFISFTSPPVSWAVMALPDQICDPGYDAEIPGLYILGDQPDALLRGETATKKAEEVGQAAAEAGVEGGFE